jgi:hypothetical protein
MTSKLRIAFFLNVFVSIVLIAFGLRYVLSSQILPYHLQVIGRGWNDLEPRLQMMLLELLKVGGIGQLSTGIALGILTLIPFRRGQRWAYWPSPSLASSTEYPLPIVPMFFTTPPRRLRRGR